MKKLTAILIDDKSKCRSTLKQKLAKYCTYIEVVAECTNGEEGIKAIKAKEPNVIFLEVEIPKVDGLTMLQHLGNTKSQLIFTCIDDHYAIDAIHFKALDYLVKPIKTNQFLEAIERIKQAEPRLKTDAHTRDLHNIAYKKVSNSCIAVHSMKGTQQIAFKDIVFIQAKNNYSIINRQLSLPITVSKTLKSFEKLLPSSVFVRIHHSWIINKNYVQSYRVSKSNKVIMSNGKTLDVSRRRKEFFMKAINR